MRSIGYPELLVIVALGGFLVFPAWKIFSKAGYPGVLSLALLVPILNIVMWWFLALSEWPVLKELKALRQRTTPSGPPLP
jgi:hypothetical protein